MAHPRVKRDTYEKAGRGEVKSTDAMVDVGGEVGVVAFRDSRRFLSPPSRLTSCSQLVSILLQMERYSPHWDDNRPKTSSNSIDRVVRFRHFGPDRIRNYD